ncbi:hypothetical protein D3C87_234330 [compost metagenome]
MKLLLNCMPFGKRHLFVFLTLVLISNPVLSFQPGTSLAVFDSEPALTKRILKGDLQVFTFKQLKAPLGESLEKSIERFKQVEGFVSLSINAQNEVELVTTQTIAANELVRLLMVSTRLFGYIGYQIVE